MDTIEHYKLTFTRESETYHGCLSLGRPPRTESTDALPAFLTEREIQQLDLYSGQRRAEYLYSRWLAKNAVRSFISAVAYDKMELLHGVFGQPILRIQGCHAPPRVSVSHKQGLVGCLIFNEEHPTGLDIEELSPVKKDLIAGKMTPAEKQRNNPEQDHQLPLLIWTAKEALSKILLCGMTAPFDFFETTDLKKEKDMVYGRFEHFKQYRFISMEKYDHAVTIVFPGKSNLSIKKFH